MNLREADADSLKRGLCDRRSSVCQSSVENGLIIARELEISIEKRITRKQQRDGEEAGDATLTASADIDRVMICTVDTPVSEIETRSKRLNGLNAVWISHGCGSCDRHRRSRVIAEALR